MKKITKILSFVIVLLTLMIGFIGESHSVKANAANVSGKLNVSFKVVDYDKYVNYLSLRDQLLDEFETNTLSEVIALYGKEAVKAGRVYVKPTISQVIRNPTWLNDPTYFNLDGIAADWDVEYDGVSYEGTWGEYGSNFYDVYMEIQNLPSRAAQTTFTPSTASKTNYFGLVYSVQSDTNLLTLAIGIQFSKVSSDTAGAGPLSDAVTNTQITKKDITIPTGSSLTTANSWVNGDNIVTVGNYSTTGAGGCDVYDETDLAIAKVPISQTANGTYTLTLADTDDVIGRFVGGAEFKKGSNGNFHYDTASITIQGASDKTTTTFTSGTSSTSANVPAVSEDHDAKMVTMDTIPASHSNAYLTGVVTASGKMPATVTYSTTKAGLATGTVVSETSSGSGMYAIPMSCATNSSMWVSVVVTASNGTTQATYTVEIPRGQYDVADLTGITFKSGGNSIGLYSSSSAISTTTFSSSTKTYCIKLKNSETLLDITPTWTANVGQSSKIITSANASGATHATSGNSVTYTHSGTTAIKVIMTSEDGNKTETYTFNVYRYSDDVTFDYFKYGIASNNLATTVNQSGSQTEYTGTAGKTATAVFFKFKPTETKATLTYSFYEDGDTPVSPTTAYTSDAVKQCTFGSTAGGATMNICVKVVSESGDYNATYKLSVERSAGSKETGINGIQVSYNGSTTYQTATNSGTAYSIATAYTFNSLTSDYFTFKINQKSGEVGQQNITYYKSDAPSSVYSYNNSESGHINFSSYAEESITIVITVQAEDSSVTPVTYNLTVTRAKASDNTDLNSVQIISSGNTYNYTLQSDNKTYKLTSGKIPYLAYSGQQFSLKFTQHENGQTFSYTSDDKNTTAGIASSGGTTTFTYADSYTEQTVTITLTVKALDNNTTKDYTIIVERDGASKETGINSLVVGYNGTAKTPSTSGNTYTLTNMPFKSKTGDYLSFKITGKDSAQTISYVSNDNAYPGSPVTVTSGSEYKIYFSSYAEETITITFTVLAPDHDKTATYTLEVTRVAASNDSALDETSFKVYKVDSNITKTQLNGSFPGAVAGVNTYQFTSSAPLDYAEYGSGSKVVNSAVGFDVKIPAYAKLTIASDKGHSDTLDNSNSATASTVTYKGQFLFTEKTATTMTFTITVEAQDSSTSVYKVAVSRKAANNDYESVVSIQANTSDGLNPYVIKTPSTILNTQLFYTSSTQELPYAVKDVNLIINSSLSTTKIYYNGTDVTGKLSEVYTIADATPVATSALTNKYFEFVVVTEADDTIADGKTMKVYYSRVAANFENEINLANIVVRDNKNNNYNLSSFTQNGDTYSILLNSKLGMTGYYIDGVEKATTTSLATIYAKDGSSTGYTDADLYNANILHNIGTGNTTYIISVSEAGVPYVYAIQVGFQEVLDEEARIKEIKIAEISASDFLWTDALTDATENQEINLSIPYSIKGLTFTVTLVSSKASMVIDDRVKALTIPEGTTSYVFQARAQDGTNSKKYTFKVTRAVGNTDNLLTKLAIGTTTILNGTDTSYEYTQDSNVIHHLISASSTNAKLSYEVSKNAIVDIRLAGSATGSNSTTIFNTNLTKGAKNEIIMRITSEKDYYDGNTSSYNEYHINVYPASDELDIDEIKAYADSDFNEALLSSSGTEILLDLDNTNQQEFHIPFTSKHAYIDVAIPARLADYINVTTTSKGSISTSGITYTIVVKSQYATLAPSDVITNSKTYKLKLIQDAASTENRLDELHVWIDNNGTREDLLDGKFNKDKNSYACEHIPTNVTEVEVTYVLTSRNHSKIAAGSNTGVIDVDLTSNKQLSITVLNELDQANTYKIDLTTGEIKWDTNANVTDIQALINGVNKIPTFAASTVNYDSTENIRATVKEVVFHVATYAPTTTVTVNGEPMDSTDANTLNTKTMSITPGIANTFTFVATSKDGSATKTYTVKLTSASAETDNTLTVFTIDGNNVLGLNTLSVKEDVESVPVLATAKSSYATLSQFNGTTPTDVELEYGENIISVTVTPEDENASPKTYSVKVIRDYPVELTNLVIYEKSDTTKKNLITIEGGVVNDTYTIPTFDYKYGDLELVIEVTAKEGNEHLTITGDGDWVVSEFGKAVTRDIVITANSGYSKTYKVTVQRTDGNHDNYITSYKINSSATTDVDGFSSTNPDISYQVDRSVEYFEPVIEASSTALENEHTGKRYSLYDANGTEITSGTPSLKVGKNIYTIKVLSEAHDENVYNVVVYRAEKQTGISNINIYTNATDNEVIKDTSGNSYAYNGQPTQRLNVANKLSQIYMKFTLSATYSKVYVNGAEFTKEDDVYQGFVKLNNTGTNPNEIRIYTISELGSLTTEFGNYKSEDYTLVILREELNTDATLKSLKVIINGLDKIPSFNSSKTEYLINSIGNASSIKIEATATKEASSTVSGTGERDISDVNSTYFTFTVTCTAEAGNSQDYIVKISRTAMSADEADNDKSVSFNVIDNNNKKVMNETFNDQVKNYTVTVPYTSQSYIITLATATGSRASLFVDGEKITSGMKQFTVGDRTAKLHTVYAQSANGEESEKYTITVSFEVPSSNANLVSITVGDRTVADLTNGNSTYKLATFDGDTETVRVYAVAEDSKTTVVGNGVYNLTAGQDTTVVIQTIAEDGITRYNYTLVIPRAAEKPYLTDLRIEGATLKNAVTNQEIDTFDPKTQNYLIEVENGSKTATTISKTIKAQVDNITYTVSCDNANMSTSGYVSTCSVNLYVGDNTFNITVQSPEDPTNKRTYTLVVKRAAAQDSDTTITMLKVARTDGISTATYRANSVFDATEKLSFTVPNSMTTLEVVPTLASATTTYKVINNDLKVGKNEVVLLVTAQDGSKTYTTIEVEREGFAFVIDILEIEDFKLDYANGKVNSKSKYTVPADVNSLTIQPKHTETTNTSKIDVVVTKGAKLEVGEFNEVEFQLICEKEVLTVSFLVYREEYEYSIASAEIQDLEKDSIKGVMASKTYNVDNSVNTLNFDIMHTDSSIDEQPTYKVISGEKLEVGDNQVVLQITSADGVVSTETINVHRNAMEFSVLESLDVKKNDATITYTCKAKTNAQDVYTIDLGKDGKASDITDYAEYISFDSSKNDLVVTTLTDTSKDDCNEVLLLVQTSDGAESRIVKIELESAKSPVNSFDLYVWIILGLALIILIIILICVNRDKYGSVSRKRKTN